MDGFGYFYVRRLGLVLCPAPFALRRVCLGEGVAPRAAAFAAQHTVAAASPSARATPCENRTGATNSKKFKLTSKRNINPPGFAVRLNRVCVHMRINE